MILPLQAPIFNLRIYKQYYLQLRKRLIKLTDHKLKGIKHDSHSYSNLYNVLTRLSYSIHFIYSSFKNT